MFSLSWRSVRSVSKAHTTQVGKQRFTEEKINIGGFKPAQPRKHGAKEVITLEYSIFVVYVSDF